MKPASPEEIARACDALAKLTPLPDDTLRGLAARDHDALRGAVWRLIGANRPQGLREVVEILRATGDFGVFAHVQSARLHRMEGDDAAALADLEALAARFPDRAQPHWELLRAQCLEALGRGEEADAALDELDAKFPASALAERERLQKLRRLDYGQDALEARVASARRRFPDEPDFRAQWVTILLARGRLEEAEREIAALEAQAPDLALAARLRLETDRGEEALRAFAEGLPARVTSVEAALQAGAELFGLLAPWAFDLAAQLMEDAARREPGDARVTILLARLRIAQRRDEEALALIDALPALDRRKEFCTLRAWGAAKRGRDEEAKGIWRDVLARNHFPAVHGPLGELRRLSPPDRPQPGEGVTAYVVLRNEAALIPAFLDHHRRLGVRRFVFFDNRSSDESRGIALKEPDVILYESSASYQLSSSGRRWVNEIVRQEGARGWGLQLDIDEHLVYPGCEQVGIERFVGYLDARGFEGVRGFLLDMFPRRLIGADGTATPLAEHRFYDDSYHLIGWERAPYLQLNGGVRARLFGANGYMHKIPIWRLDAGVLINSHETTHLRLADVSAALLHFKLFNVARRGREATPEQAGAAFLEADADVDATRRHARYAARLQTLWGGDLFAHRLSREIGDSGELTARGLLEASAEYGEFCNATAEPRAR